MKKQILILFFAFLLFSLNSCGKKQKLPSLDEDMEAVIRTYFNYEAWCHPDEIVQEGLSYPYEAYQTGEEQRFPKTYLKFEREEGEAWYCCTYTRQEAYYMERLKRSLPENLNQVALGEISLEKITKPVFGETAWKTENIEIIKKRLGDLCSRAFYEEYRAGESFEIYLTDFCPENGIMPMLYIIWNDEVCELRGGMGHYDDWMRADMELTFGVINEDGWFDTVPKNEISEEKFSHIREIAVLHLEYQKEKKEGMDSVNPSPTFVQDLEVAENEHLEKLCEKVKQLYMVEPVQTGDNTEILVYEMAFPDDADVPGAKGDFVVQYQLPCKLYYETYR